MRMDNSLEIRFSSSFLLLTAPLRTCFSEAGRQQSQLCLSLRHLPSWAHGDIATCEAWLQTLTRTSLLTLEETQAGHKHLGSSEVSCCRFFPPAALYITTKVQLGTLRATCVRRASPAKQLTGNCCLWKAVTGLCHYQHALSAEHIALVTGAARVVQGRWRMRGASKLRKGAQALSTRYSSGCRPSPHSGAASVPSRHGQCLSFSLKSHLCALGFSCPSQITSSSLYDANEVLRKGTLCAAQAAPAAAAPRRAVERAPADESGNSAASSDADEEQPLPGELDDEGDSEGSAGGGVGWDDAAGSSEDEPEPDQDGDDEELSGAASRDGERHVPAARGGAAPAGRRLRSGAPCGGGGDPAVAGNGHAAQVEARRGRPALQEDAKAARRRSGADAGPSGAGGFFAETPQGTRFAAASFAELHLSRPLLKAVAELGYTRTTPIQARRRERLSCEYCSAACASLCCLRRD